MSDMFKYLLYEDKVLMSDTFEYLLYEDEGGIDIDVRVEADHIMVMMSDVKDPSKMVCVKFGSEVDSGLDWVKTYLDILKQQRRDFNYNIAIPPHRINFLGWTDVLDRVKRKYDEAYSG